MKFYKIIIIVLLFLFSCANKVSVSEIKAHPRDYVNKTVMVTGEVKATFSLGFLNYFEIDDGSGIIDVVSQKPLPQKGEFLEITGIVKYYTIATINKLVIFEEE